MESAGQLPGIGWSSLALSFASLGLVCLVAWGALRLLAGRGVGRASGAVKVVARCPLEPRRSVYVIEAAGRCFLIGVGDGPMAVLAELEPDKLPKADPAQAVGARFAEVLGRVLARPPAKQTAKPTVATPGPVEATARERT